MKEYLPGILNAVTGLGALLVSFLLDLRLPIPGSEARLAGIIVVIAGMSLVVWAALHVRRAFLGEVEPVLDHLVRDGPYRHVRHPVYLGMTVALAGAAISVRSWPGLLAVLLAFLPSEIYRARLEERALSRVFGREWEDYAEATGFLFPLR